MVWTMLSNTSGQPVIVHSTREPVHEALFFIGIFTIS